MLKYIIPVAVLSIIGFTACNEQDPPPAEKETVIIKEKEVPVKEVPVQEEGTRIHVGDDGLEVESKDVDVDVNTDDKK